MGGILKALLFKILSEQTVVLSEQTIVLSKKNMAQMFVGRIKSSICWTNMHEKYGLRVGLPIELWFETRSDIRWGLEYSITTFLA